MGAVETIPAIASFEIYDQQSTAYNKQKGDDLCLGRMKTEDVVFGIDPDLFHKKPLKAVYDQVNPEHHTRRCNPLPDTPEKKEQA